MHSVVAEHARALSRWLIEDAFPFWWERGADKENGGFFEVVGLDGVPVAQDRRSRVQPRQSYCYAAAHRMGWNGPSLDAVRHGLRHFERVYRRGDGFYGSIESLEGRMIDRSFDLYNQAFALFAFGHAADVLTDEASIYAERALGLLERLKASYAHPQGGFEEARPRRLPLCSNPHMHLFEAALFWEDIADPSPAPWRDLSDGLAALCLDSFIDPQSGALHEFFDGNWRRYPGDQGRIVEPGHQFEWAWLLTRWGRSRSDERALAHARRFFEIGVDHGLCPRRGVAVMALNDDFTVRDPIARLWPQTEWIKAAIILAETADGAERERYVASIAKACAAFRRFLEVPVSGAWRDKMRPDGSFADEPAPASSFYHIVGAIHELRAFSLSR